MTTKPSAAPWADEPYTLLSTPTGWPDPGTHTAIWAAGEMSLVHNALLRSLNAIVLQGPHVPSSDQTGYCEQDVKDLCFYVESWVKMVDHHHHTEEIVLFPEVEAMAGKPGLMSAATEQHARFHDGMKQLGELSENFQAEPGTYRWSIFQKVIDAFAPALVEHLNEEIEILKSLREYDSEAINQVWAKAEKVAKANGNMSLLYGVFPTVLSAADKTFEGGNTWPPLPSVLPYLIKYWFAGYHPGAWRFSPCDFWGQPRPLPMLPENRAVV